MQRNTCGVDKIYIAGVPLTIHTPIDFIERRVKTADGLSIYTQEWGNPEGPAILFIHGVAQSYLSFVKQTRSELAKDFRMITFDLRGHGVSDKPSSAEHYAEGRRWADDIQSIIDAYNLVKPVLVGWSMGGRVIAEYLTHYGDGNISGINIVGSRTFADPNRPVHGPGALNHLAGPMLSDDLETNIAGTRGFVRACTAKPLLPEEFDLIVAFNMMCPAYVKRSILLWSGDYKQTLSNIQVPVLITHGKADEIVLPEMAQYTADAVSGAKISWYDGVGHSPFWENPCRFNGELAVLVKMTHDN
ncbi:MAG: alpha/beta hydrolase [Syntrophales bacterium]|nr:alpha/beta hydrolase [Syntrophales bacterium]